MCSLNYILHNDIVFNHMCLTVLAPLIRFCIHCRLCYAKGISKKKDKRLFSMMYSLQTCCQRFFIKGRFSMFGELNWTFIFI